MDPFLGNTSCAICDQIEWAWAQQAAAQRQGTVCVNTDDLIQKSMLLSNMIWVLLIVNAILFVVVYVDWKKALGSRDKCLIKNWWGWDFNLSDAIPMTAFMLGFMLNFFFGIFNWIMRFGT